MNRLTLKQNLKKIKENHFEIYNNDSYAEYAKVMLQYIGDPDAELRDELIYEIFNAWIEAWRFKKEELYEFLRICIDEEHLFYKIGEEGMLSVYTRTFSALIIASIVYEHVNSSFLPEKLVEETYHAAVTYFKKERDLRGYTQEGGWAHGVAHGSDMLMVLAQCPEIKEAQLKTILSLIRAKVCQGNHVYIEGEPVRMARVISSIVARNKLAEDDLCSWIQMFQNDKTDTTSILYLHERENIDHFMRCLYFEIKVKADMPKLLDHIEKRVLI